MYLSNLFTPQLPRFLLSNSLISAPSLSAPLAFSSFSPSQFLSFSPLSSTLFSYFLSPSNAPLPNFLSH